MEVRDDTDTKLSAKADGATIITAGAGLTGGGDLSAGRTLDVVANVDASIVVNANDVQVGVLASDAQHGVRGGGTQHANAVASGAAGFISGADQAKLDGIAAGAEVNVVDSVAARTGDVVLTSDDVSNDSAVTGADVTAALDALDGAKPEAWSVPAAVTGTTDTIATANNRQYRRYTNASGCTITVDQSVAGDEMRFVAKAGAGTLTFTPGAGMTLDATGLTQANVDEVVRLFFESATVATLTKDDIGGTGNVVGPGSSTDEAFARFDSTTGVLLQNGVVGADDLGNVTGVESVLITHTATENDDFALEIVANAAGFADVKAVDIDFVTGALATGEEDEAILINIDEVASTGGRVAAFEVIATNEGSAEVDALEVGAAVNPIRQLSGNFGDLDSLLVIAVDQLTALSTGGAGNVSVFVNDDDTITFGDAAQFAELEFIVDTPASGAGIAPTWEYSTGVGTWTAFSPADGTNGMRNTGVAGWVADDLAGWIVGTGGEFLVRLTRTRNSLTTTPILDLVQRVPSATYYTWDASGDVVVNSLHGALTTTDAADPTKEAAFVTTAITTGTTRTITVPDANVDLTLVAAHASRHERAGADELDGDHLDIDFTPANYTPSTTPAEAADVDDLAAHLQGIDTAIGLAGSGGNDFVDNVFRIQQFGDITAEVDFDASAITTGTVRTVTVPDANVDLTLVAAHASRHERAGADEIDGDHLDIDFTPANYTPAITPAEAAHVDDLAAHLQGIDTALAGGGGGPTIQEVTGASATIGSGSHRVYVDTDIVVTLTMDSSPTVGDKVEVVDRTGESHMRPISVARAGSQLINGETTFAVDRPYARAIFEYVASNVWLARVESMWDPTRLMHKFESFDGNAIGVSDVGGSDWYHQGGSGGSVQMLTGEAGAPGIIELGDAGSGRSALHSPHGATGNAGFILTDGPGFIEWRIRIPILPTGTEDFAVLVGLLHNTNDTGPDPGMNFIALRGLSTTNWFAAARDTVGYTEEDTGTALPSADTWTTLRIAWDDGGDNVVFLADGVEIHTMNGPTDSDTIPTAARTVGVEIIRQTGTTARTVEIDYCEVLRLLT